MASEAGPSLSEGLGALPRLVELCEGWSALRAALASGHSATIDGAWGSAASLALAALAQPGDCWLAVIPHASDLPYWAEDLASFRDGSRPLLFPAWETWPPADHRGRLDPITAERLRFLQELLSAPPPIILTTLPALIQPVPPPDEFQSRGREIRLGQVIAPDELVEWLIAHGYKRVEAVEYPGDFSRRGGICDIFPPGQPEPVRLEFFGDEVESLRRFAVGSQRSLGQMTALRVVDARPDQSLHEAAAKPRGFLADYLPPSARIALVEPDDLHEQGKLFFERVADPTGLFTIDGVFAQLLTRPSVVISSFPRATVEQTVHLRVESVEKFSGNVHRVRDELDAATAADDSRVMIACQSEAERQRLREVLKAGRLAESQRLQLVLGHVREGFRLVDARLVVLGSHQLFHRELLPTGIKSSPGKRSRRVESRAIDSFLDLNEGDLVVHVAHGIARFRGMTMLEKSHGLTSTSRVDTLHHLSPLQAYKHEQDHASAAYEEHLILEFRDGVFLYVPASRIDLVQKYVGGSKVEPELSRLGGTSWGKKKQKVADAVRDLAAEMLRIQALRASTAGMPLKPDTDWQKEFEAAFPYDETPDQLIAIEETKADLERPKPMDRLICGDVGYGKTEIAIRAAFKVVDNGKQVAILVPTTVLAEQHYRTFRQRFAEYPFTVEVISRFKSPAQQREVLARVASGEVDVVIGTHRLLSSDVVFKDLGLAIIDEEQRFGVEHKERLKQLRAMVHVLTMTATPIPRTLHAALLGIREISNLETSPPGRLPVETRIIRWDDQMIRHAILRELNREGQVYFVHNRVHDIHQVAQRVQAIVPEARIVVGHGQMAAEELEQAMVRFVRREADILVSTTIIESGLDIPSANTIFIDDADIYGLADLHQLRGRVGREKVRAYAYLIVNPLKLITPNAQRRLKAIEEFTELGAGFKIAMRDLEIRGAGNILGTEQSGHIAAVGYEMYCQLLENAVRALKHQPPREAVDVNVDLPWPAFLPRDYVPGQKLRLEVYRRLARLRDLDTLNDFRQELQDRFGPLPEPVEWLLRTTEVRLLCVRWTVASIHRDGPDLVLTYRDGSRAAALASASRKRLKVVDEKSLYLRLQAGEETDEAVYRLLVRLLSEVESMPPKGGEQTPLPPRQQRTASEDAAEATSVPEGAATGSNGQSPPKRQSPRKRNPRA